MPKTYPELLYSERTLTGHYISGYFGLRCVVGTAMIVLLVGNYPLDGSTSMHTWARALERELGKVGVEVRLIYPRPVLGRWKPSATGAGKWLGYLDRFLLFPREMRAAAVNADVVHICDHGSAMYSQMVKGKPVVITCHDMLAVRGALGEVPDCPASFFGRRLQRWISRGLRSANRVACVSQATYEDARRILKINGKLRVILNGLNYPFHPVSRVECDHLLANLPQIQKPFILHVGSSLVRKNRDGVLRVFASAAQGADFQLVFAGAPLTPDLVALATKLGVYGRTVQVYRPDVKVIEALYTRATALLFPSRYEGFGWPPIEAQACGCPVVASDIPPLVEVLGQSAIVKPLTDETGMAQAIRTLATDGGFREHMRQAGFENVQARFQTSRMIHQYLSLYREILCAG
jgi:glycosyltransferase involved in cell wall biosynthesis